MNSASEERGKTGQNVIAGITTFAAMSYIMFANPAILEPIGMTPGPVFIWTCIVAAISSLVAGASLNTPTALACGMGLNIFIANYARAHGIPWPVLILVCGVVSFIVLLLSMTRLRRNLLDAIPDQIFAAIKAAIGSILVKVAIDEAKAVAAVGPFWRMIVVFLCGLAVIVVIKWLYASRPQSRPIAMLNSLSYVLSIIVMIPMTMLITKPTSLTPEPNRYWDWGPDALNQITEDKLFLALPFAIAVLFVLMIDIAGSPYEYVRQGSPGANLGAAEKDKIVDRSLWIDSACNIVASIAAVTPVVYYAENHVGWKANGRTGVVAITVGVAFLCFAVLGVVSVASGRTITEIVPKFAVMPALFFVGLTVIAESFALRLAGMSEAVSPHDPLRAYGLPTATSVPTNRPEGWALNYLPAAITVVLVTNSSFEVAIAAGILSHAFIDLLPADYLGRPTDPRSGYLGSIYISAMMLLLLSLWH
jgi:adenine/guanine/hypoxanthine permease